MTAASKRIDSLDALRGLAALAVWRPRCLLEAPHRFVWQYSTFVWKRIVRLEPPYLVSILFVILIGYLGSCRRFFRNIDS